MDRSASVNFDANTDRYTQSLQQAIAVTNQYSKAADTMLGKVANLGGTMATSLVNKTAALTQANKIATAQAAAYQQKLSQLEVTSKVLGDKTFPKLEKATKSLATQFPIGIDAAVKTMESLQESGVTNIATVEKMSKAYTKLGAATGSYAPEVGKQMTELNRSMGNNLSMIEGMGDSLTVLTKKYGGTASGVLAFSKSIAPIAATVGMNQTQVMGLSTAFSRLGEDGFAAGNAINKVLLDLDRSVRNGTPELRNYANAMNKSVEGLREQFQNDPMSVVTDFTAAITKSGPDAIRTLEMLGIEGVRTTKAITSLAREGTLGEIVNTASTAFGGGAASRGAETAMGGVNDQITRLNETMSQTAAAAGRPFVEMLESVLKASNNVAGAFNDIVNSGFMQQLGKVGQVGAAVASGVVSGGANLVGTAMTIGMGVRAYRYAGNRMGDFAAGRNQVIGQAAGVTGVLRDPDNWASRAGASAARARGLGAMDYALIAGTAPQGTGALGRAGGAMRGSLQNVRGLASLLALTSANDMRSAFGQEKLTTPAGQKLSTDLSAARSALRAGDVVPAGRQAATALTEFQRAVGGTTKVFPSLTSSMLNLTRATGMVYATSAKNALSAMTGLGPGGLAAVGVGALAFGGYKYAQNQKKDTAAIAASAEDPYRLFNTFAEKAGYATRTVSALGDAAEKAAKQILGEENKTAADAYTITEKEIALSKEAGYTAAFKSTGRVEEDVRQVALMNPNMSPEETSRIVTDVMKGNTVEYGRVFATQLQAARKEQVDDPVGYALKSIEESNSLRDSGFKGWFKSITGADSGKEIAAKGQVADAMNQRYEQTKSSSGQDAADRQRASDAKRMYEEAAAGKVNPDDVLPYIAQALGVDEKALRKGVTSTPTTEMKWTPGGGGSQMITTMGSYMTLEQVLASQASNPDAVDALGALKRTAAGTPLTAAAPSVNLTQNREADAATKRLIGVNVDLADVMHEGNKVSGSLGKRVGELTEVELKKMTPTGRAIAEVQMQPQDPDKILKAGQAVAAYVLEKTEGSSSKAQTALIQELAIAVNDGSKAAVLAAMEQVRVSPQAVMERTGKAPMEQLRTRIQSGVDAAAMQLPSNANPEAVEARKQAMTDAADAVGAYREMVKATAIQVRDSMISMDRSETDFYRQRGRQVRDFNRQQEWAGKAHRHSEYLANRDFRTQQLWGEQDHDRQRKYTKEDYQRSTKRAEEAFDRSMERAQFDYQKQSQRATEDFHRSRARAQVDFTKQMARAEADYYTNRNRMIADHDKSLKRQIEDSAKSMYSPYERILHNRVWDTKQLVANLKEQNKYLQEQMNNVAKLKESGLSQQSIDLLALTDPGNAQQAARMAKEAKPGDIAALNAAAATRGDIGKAFATSDNNVEYRRAEEDFATSLGRMSEDFSKSTTRAVEDFNVSMVRSAEDFSLSMSRSADDFSLTMKRSNEDFRISMDQASQDYTISLKRSEKEYDIAVARAKKQHALQMAELDYQYAEQLRQQNKTFKTAMADSVSDFNLGKARMVEDLTKGMADLTASYDEIIADAKGRVAGLPEDLKSPLEDALDIVLTGLNEQIKAWNAGDAFAGLLEEFDTEYEKWVNKERPKFKLRGEVLITSPSNPLNDSNKGGGGGSGAGAGPGGTGSAGLANHFSGAVGDSTIVGKVGDQVTRRPVYRRCLANVRNAKHYLGDGIHHWQDEAHKVGDALKREGLLNKGYSAPAGALYWWSSAIGGGAGHVAVSDGRGNAINNWGGSTVERNAVSRMAPSAYMGWSSYKALSEGGIATRQTPAMIGEGGYPEMVLPLNDRGIQYLTAVMSRYMDNDTVRASSVAPYAKNVTFNSFTYDQSTKILGPVTVQAESPAELGKQLAAKTRRDRLIQPVGSAR